MFNSKQTYINNLSVATPVVYKSQEVSAEFKGKGFIAAAVMAVSFGVLSIQAGYVINANANGNPISSPVSYSESPSPSASASSAPVTSPEVSPSPSANPSSNNGGGNNGGGGNGGGGNSSGSSNSGGGSSSAPSCNNEAPKAPVIVSAVTTGKNEITLYWSKPLGNVTHYSVSYGVMKNKPLYGVANVGNVTSFAVRGLSGGTTFYFTVKAVNDCTPSLASNEVAIKVGGKFISSPAQGFKPGVLGKSVKNTNTSSSASLKPAATPAPAASVVPVSTPKQSNSGLLGKVTSFFSNIF